MVRVTIDENLCKGCGLCARACPKHIIELSKTRINAKGYHPAEVIIRRAVQSLRIDRRRSSKELI